MVAKTRDETKGALDCWEVHDYIVIGGGTVGGASMISKEVLANWHGEIIRECQKRLRRTLTEVEKIFITSREGFIALEAIEEVVKSLAGKKLEGYLNSASKK